MQAGFSFVIWPSFVERRMSGLRGRHGSVSSVKRRVERRIMYTLLVRMDKSTRCRRQPIQTLIRLILPIVERRMGLRESGWTSRMPFQFAR
jgi:hypothetical protein